MSTLRTRVAAVVGAMVGVGAFAVVAPVGSAPAVAAGPCGAHGVFAQSGSTASCTYTTGGEDTFTAPAGVGSVRVVAGRGTRRCRRPL